MSNIHALESRVLLSADPVFELTQRGTLVIHGTVDPLVRPEGGQDTADSVPGAKLLMIEGMGHALPAQFWPEIIDAIDKHAHGAASKAA